MRFMLHVCLLYRRLQVSSTAPGKRKMGNSLKSTPPPLERPLPGTEGESDFFGDLFNSVLQWYMGKPGLW